MGTLLSENYIDLAKIKFNQHRLDDAHVLIEDALILVQGLNESDSRLALRSTLLQLKGRLLAFQQNNDAAIQCYETAAAALQRVSGVTEFSRSRHRQLAELHQLICTSLQRIGRLNDAEAAMAKALLSLESHNKRNAGAPRDQETIGNLLRGMGRLQLIMGEPQRALESWHESVQVQELLVSQNPQVLRFRLQLAESWHLLSNVQVAINKLDVGQAAIRNAIKIREEIAEEHSEFEPNLESLAEHFQWLANILFKLQRYKSARDNYQKSMALWNSLLVEAIEQPRHQRRFAGCQYDQARLEIEMGNLESASRFASDAHKTAQKLVQKYPDVSDYQRFWLKTVTRLADCLSRQGRLDEARALIGEGRNDSPRLSRLNTESDPSVTFDIAYTLYHLSRQQSDLGDFQMALETVNRSRELMSMLVQSYPDHPEYPELLINCLNQAATMMTYLRKYPESRVLFDEAVLLVTKWLTQFPNSHLYLESMIRVHLNRGILFSKTMRLEEAKTSYQTALQLFQSIYAEDSDVSSQQRLLAEIQTNLGAAYKDAGQHQLSVRSLEKSVGLWRRLTERFPQSSHLQFSMGTAVSNLGQSLSKLRLWPRAVDAFDEALEILEPIVEREQDHQRAKSAIGITHWGNAVALMRTRQYKPAADAWGKTDRWLPKSSSRYIFLTQRAECLIQAGEPELAIKVAEQIAAILPESGRNYWWAARTTAMAIAAIQKENPVGENVQVQASQAHVVTWLLISHELGHLDAKLTRQLLFSPAFQAVRNLDGIQDLIEQAQNRTQEKEK